MRLVLLLCAFIAVTLFVDASPVALPRNCAAAPYGVRYGAPGTRSPKLPGRIDGSGPSDVPRGHAHNDYQHRHPLLDALADGFTSVEADVWAVDGQLMVAHDRSQVDPSRTLESLYLQPLARAAGSRPRTPHLQLLVDVKGDPATTLSLLRSELAPYAAVLTSYHGCTTTPGPVSVVVSGGDVPLTAPGTRTSLFGYDLHLERAKEAAVDRAVTPLVSARWGDYFGWDGQGPMPADERERLDEVVDSTHAAGSAIRFWGTPNDPGPARAAVWRELTAAGVDYISTNDLAGYAAFAHRTRGQETPGRLARSQETQSQETRSQEPRGQDVRSRMTAVGGR